MTRDEAIRQINQHGDRLRAARLEYGAALICPDCYLPVRLHVLRMECGQALAHGQLVAEANP